MANEVIRRRLPTTKCIDHSARCTTTACFEKGNYLFGSNVKKLNTDEYNLSQIAVGNQ